MRISPFRMRTYSLDSNTAKEAPILGEQDLVDLKDLFDSASDLTTKPDEENDKPQYVPPREIHLGQWNTVLTQRRLMERDRLRMTSMPGPSRMDDPECPWFLERVRRESVPERFSIDDATRNDVEEGPAEQISQWLSDGLGRNQVFENRFEAWFDTQLDLMMTRKRLKEVIRQAQQWRRCSDICLKVKFRLLDDYCYLKGAGKILQDNLKTLGLRGVRYDKASQQVVVVGSDEPINVLEEELETDDESARREDAAIEAWVEQNPLPTSTPMGIRKNCERLAQVGNNIIEGSIGEDLPGLDMSFTRRTPLKIAIHRVEDRMKVDSRCTYVKAIKYLAKLVDQKQREMFRIAIEAEIMGESIRKFLRYHRAQESDAQSRKETLKRTREEQMQSLEEAAEKVYQEGSLTFVEETQDPVHPGVRDGVRKLSKSLPSAKEERSDSIMAREILSSSR